MAFIALTLILSGCERSPSAPTAVAPAAQTTTLHFKVQGMVCEGCEEAITETLKHMPGVREVHASHVAGTVDVQTTNPSQQAAIGEAITKLNYTVES